MIDYLIFTLQLSEEQNGVASRQAAQAIQHNGGGGNVSQKVISKSTNETIPKAHSVLTIDSFSSVQNDFQRNYPLSIV